MVFEKLLLNMLKDSLYFIVFADKPVVSEKIIQFDIKDLKYL